MDSDLTRKVGWLVARFPFDIATQRRLLRFGGGLTGQLCADGVSQISACGRVLVEIVDARLDALGPCFIHLTAVVELVLGVEKKKIGRTSCRVNLRNRNRSV